MKIRLKKNDRSGHYCMRIVLIGRATDLAVRRQCTTGVAMNSES